MTLKVFGMEVDVQIKNEMPLEGAVAVFYPGDKRIELFKGSSELFRDFGHEVFHAFWHRLGLRQSGISSEVEEIIVENLSVFLEENMEDFYKFYKKTKKK